MRPAQIISTLVFGLASLLAHGQTQSDFGYEYFSVVGKVQAEAKSVGWFAEICAESFPEIKSETLKAYDEWTTRNRTALRDLDAQYDVIERYWLALPERDRHGMLSKQQMERQLEEQRPAFRRNFIEGDRSKFFSMCAQYGGVLRSKGYDVEARRPAELKVIRRGPQ